MVEGHVTDSDGIEKIKTYLRSQQYIKQPINVCPTHNQPVQIVDEETKIVMRGCCKEVVYAQLDQISRTIDWLDFYNSINSLD